MFELLGADDQHSARRLLLKNKTDTFKLSNSWGYSENYYIYCIKIKARIGKPLS